MSFDGIFNLAAGVCFYFLLDAEATTNTTTCGTTAIPAGVSAVSVLAHIAHDIGYRSTPGSLAYVTCDQRCVYQVSSIRTGNRDVIQTLKKRKNTARNNVTAARRRGVQERSEE